MTTLLQGLGVYDGVRWPSPRSDRVCIIEFWMKHLPLPKWMSIFPQIEKITVVPVTVVFNIRRQKNKEYFPFFLVQKDLIASPSLGGKITGDSCLRNVWSTKVV